MIALSIVGLALLGIAAICLISSLLMMTLDIGGSSGNVPMTLMGFFITFAVIGVIFIIPAIAQSNDDVMKECMQDHKRYECEAMLNRRGNDVAVVPVVVPVR